MIETIRDRNDLVSLVSEYLALKKSGQNYTGLCPFHSEKTPSFVVSPVKQIFHCFGCDVGGNVFQFLMKIEGFSFPEALERLAEKGGVPLPASSPRRGEGPAVREADQIYQLNEAVAAYLHKNLLEKPEAARATAYLKERGIDAETINAFSIGFALPRRDDLLKRFGKTFPVSLLEKAGLVSKKSGEGPSSGEADYFDRFRNRVIFPIRTLQGKVVGFGGRVLDDALPKYLNTPETAVYTKGKHLFALDQAKKKGARSLIIVEGYFDAIMAHQAGVHNVVATLGTSLTEDHLQLIRRIAEKVTLIFDPDDAGVRAALRTAPLFIEKEIAAEVVSLPSGEDPDLFLRKNGKGPFLKRVSEGKTLIDFAISKFIEASPLKSIDDKIKVIKETFPLLEKLKNKIEQSHYLKMLSEELGIEEESLRAEFSKEATKKKGAPFPKNLTKAPSAPKPDLPQDEENIATFLLQGQLDPSALTNRIDLEDFTDPRIKRVLSHFWDDQTGWRRPSGRLDAVEETEETRALVTRLSVREIWRDIEDVGQTAADSISRLRAKRVQRKSGEIQKRLKLAEKGGDLSLVKSLQQEILVLKKSRVI